MSRFARQYNIRVTPSDIALIKSVRVKHGEVSENALVRIALRIGLKQIQAAPNVRLSEGQEKKLGADAIEEVRTRLEEMTPAQRIEVVLTMCSTWTDEQGHLHSPLIDIATAKRLLEMDAATR